MAERKRTDPGKLAKEREAIRKSKEQLSDETPKKSLVGQFLERIQTNTRVRRERIRGYGPAPQKEGALQDRFINPKSGPPRVRGALVTGSKRRSESA